MNKYRDITKFLIESHLDDNLVSFLKRNIIPLYEKNDRGHNKEHLSEVIVWSFKIADLMKEKLNYNMIYTIAVFHDCAVFINRENHEKLSAEYVNKYRSKLREFFSDSEINTIHDAVEDHRASSGRLPRSLYGCIVSDADRAAGTTDIRVLIKRCWDHRLKNMPHIKNNDDMFEDIYDHLTNKYGKGGYAKIILKESKILIEPTLKKIRFILSSKERTRKIFDQMIEDGTLQWN